MKIIPAAPGFVALQYCGDPEHPVHEQLIIGWRVYAEDAVPIVLGESQYDVDSAPAVECPDKSVFWCDERYKNRQAWIEDIQRLRAKADAENRQVVQ